MPVSLFIYVCVGISGIHQRRDAKASYSNCRVEYKVEFDDATLPSLWEWVYADKLFGCEALIRALEKKQVHVEEVETDESKEEESESESEEEEESEQEVEGQDGEEWDAPLEQVVKTEGTYSTLVLFTTTQ